MILVTGATSGIGAAAVLRLASRGHLVVASGRRGDALESLEAEARRLAAANADYGVVETLRMDVRDEDSIRGVAREIDGRSGHSSLDALVNNAGYSNPGPLEVIGMEELREQFETNVFGALNLTRRFVPLMRATGGRRVINVSSPMGRITLPFHGAYNASKYALEAVSDALRMELAPFGIHVAIVWPGLIRSDFPQRAVANALRCRGRERIYDEILDRFPAIYERAYARGAPPEHAARLIERAVEDCRPRARYAYTRDRLQTALLAHLPIPLADVLKRRALDYLARPLRRPSGTIDRAGAPSGVAEGRDPVGRSSTLDRGDQP